MCNATKRIGPKWLFKVNAESSKVVDFGTNRMRVCDFLSVINSNPGFILYSFENTVAYWAIAKIATS